MFRIMPKLPCDDTCPFNKPAPALSFRYHASHGLVVVTWGNIGLCCRAYIAHFGAVCSQNVLVYFFVSSSSTAAITCSHSWRFWIPVKQYIACFKRLYAGLWAIELNRRSRVWFEWTEQRMANLLLASTDVEWSVEYVESSASFRVSVESQPLYIHQPWRSLHPTLRSVTASHSSQFNNRDLEMQDAQRAARLRSHRSWYIVAAASLLIVNVTITTWIVKKLDILPAHHLLICFNASAITSPFSRSTTKWAVGI